MNKPFKIKFGWEDFENVSKLNDFQRYQIKRRHRDVAKDAIQKTINQSISDHNDRRSELNAHKNPENPFRLDIGGEG